MTPFGGGGSQGDSLVDTGSVRGPFSSDGGAISRRASLGLIARGAMLSLVVGALPGCYRFSGGGGLPKHLKTVAIQPFDNQTAAPELQRELFEQLRSVLRDRLNLREAPEAKADLVVRGTIVAYDVDLPLGAAADARNTTSTRRRLQLTIDIEIIETATTRPLLDRKGLTREGQYAEGGEVSGRKNAIESLLADIVEGVQSQW